MNKTTNIRPSPIAGQWYPADSQRLASSVDRYIDHAVLPELPGEVIAVVAPHAGHIYSGPVAGYAFAALRGKKSDVAVVVSPMHYPYYEPLLTTGHDAYHTPLGVIPVNSEALNILDSYLFESLGFRLTRIKNDEEHSLEIELPFLQRSLEAPFSLIPIMMRDQGLRTAHALGLALARLLSESDVMSGKKYVLVASSDLSHFYDQESANLLDDEILKKINAFDPEGLIRVENEEKGFACGYGAMAAVLFAARALGADHARVVQHATSGDITGDYDRVVGYAAAVITRPGT